MRILHTSDWHVGRTIRGRSRAAEHRAVLDELVGFAGEHAVDLVVVAGDLFDTAAPGPESEEIVYDALLRLAATGAEVVVVAGNHDNQRRLAAVRPLLGLTRVHTAAQLARPDEGGVLELTSRDGETARIALVPFLSQRSIVKADQLMALDADDHAGRYAARCRAIVEALTAGFTRDTVNLVVAHLTVASGEPVMGGGERAAHTIFDYIVPPQIFPTSAHYVALGHLHKAHRIDGPCPIWYSGSPLHLDFGEASDGKHALLVEASPGTPARVERLALRSGRRLRTLRGTLDELRERAHEVGDDHLRIVVEEPARAGLADEVRDRFPNAVDVTIARDREEDGALDWDVEQLTASADELLADYLTYRDVDDPALVGLFRELWDEVTADEGRDDAA
jgi:DNA repair protein SbcD/Mre11